MTTFRKILITAAAITVPVLAYLAWSGSDNSYSEKQRQAWNELIAYNNTTHPKPTLNYFPGVPATEYDREKPQRLCRTEGPDWSVEVPAHPCLSKLPLQGLTEAELLLRIKENGDARACLALSRRYTWETFDSISQKKKWIAEAVRLGIPEASYLLQLVAHYETQLPSRPSRGVDERLKTSTAKDFLFLESLPGYHDFKSAIAAGNTDLYWTLISIDNSLVISTFYHDIKAGLKKRSSAGDAAADWQLGKVELFPLFYGTWGAERISAEMEASKPEWLNAIRKWIGLKPLLGKSSTWEQAIVAAKRLKKGADQGDLEATYAWFAYGAYLQAPFDRKTWKDLVEHADLLVKSGYAEFFTSQDHLTTTLTERIPHIILVNYYSENSTKHTLAAMAKSFARRGSAQEMFDELFNLERPLYESLLLSDVWKDKMKCSALLDRIETLCPGLIYRNGWYVLFFDQDIDPGIRDQIENLIAAHARQGDPLAAYALGDLVLKGLIERKVNVRELWEDAWPAAKKFNTYRLVQDPDMPLGAHRSQAYLIYDGLMSLYLGSDNVRDDELALKLASDYEAFSDEFCPYKAYYHLGLMYERNKGVGRDLEQAFSQYKQGALAGDYRCVVSLARCYEQGIGTLVDLEKALEYYRQAYDMTPEPLLGEPDDPDAIERAISQIEQMIQTDDDDTLPL